MANLQRVPVALAPLRVGLHDHVLGLLVDRSRREYRQARRQTLQRALKSGTARIKWATA